MAVIHLYKNDIYFTVIIQERLTLVKCFDIKYAAQDPLNCQIITEVVK